MHMIFHCCSLDQVRVLSVCLFLCSFVPQPAENSTFLLFFIDDGGVRVWRNYTEREPELVTAWQALSSLLPSTRGRNLVNSKENRQKSSHYNTFLAI